MWRWRGWKQGECGGEGRGWKQGECGGGGDGNRVSVEGEGMETG